METIYQGKYIQLTYNNRKSILARHWQSASEEMSEAEFKQEMLKILGFVQKYRPKHLLANMTSFAFVISPTLQEWCDWQIYREFAKFSISKMAMIESKEFYSEISVELALDESVKPYEVAFFKSLREAEDWLYN